MRDSKRLFVEECLTNIELFISDSVVGVNLRQLYIYRDIYNAVELVTIGFPLWGFRVFFHLCHDHYEALHQGFFVCLVNLWPMVGGWTRWARETNKAVSAPKDLLWCKCVQNRKPDFISVAQRMTKVRAEAHHSIIKLYGTWIVIKRYILRIREGNGISWKKHIFIRLRLTCMHHDHRDRQRQNYSDNVTVHDEMRLLLISITRTITILSLALAHQITC